MGLVKALLSSNMPLWVKLGIAALLIGAVVAWWARGYWQDLHTPNQISGKRKARPPF